MAAPFPALPSSSGPRSTATRMTRSTALGCELDESGFVRVDGTGRTSVPGVWAAGNVANPRAQVITAAGEGSTAAISINADLVQKDVERALSANASSFEIDEPERTTHG